MRKAQPFSDERLVADLLHIAQDVWRGGRFQVHRLLRRCPLAQRHLITRRGGLLTIKDPSVFASEVQHVMDRKTQQKVDEPYTT